MLHGSAARICNVVVRNWSIPHSRSSNYLAPSKEELVQANNTHNALLPMQEIMVEGQRKVCVTFFDPGSNTNLIHREPRPAWVSSHSAPPGYRKTV